MEVVKESELFSTIVFYDDINPSEKSLLFGLYPILTTEQEVIDHFETKGKEFTIGIGNAVLRKRMYDKFKKLGGAFKSTISNLATIGSYDVSIGKGTNILPGAILSNSVTTGLGCIIYYNAILTHDVVLGDFVEISPAATLLGRCKIGHYSQVGANATILTDVKIGNNVIIAAGAVVIDNVPDNCMVAGVPSVIKKQLKPLNF